MTCCAPRMRHQRGLRDGMAHQLDQADLCYQHRDDFVCGDGGNGERVFDLELSFLGGDGCDHLDSGRRGSWYDEDGC